MKITFVYRGGESLGLEHLSSVLKKGGHKTDVVLDPDLFSGQNFFTNNFLSRVFEQRSKMLDEIKSQGPDLLAFSVVSSSYQWALNLARELKKILSVPVVFGGMHPTLVPERTIRNDCVDMVIIREGEYALLELADSLQGGRLNYNIANVWFKKGGSIVRNPLRPLIQDLDSLPFPDKPLFYDKFPVFRNEYTIISSRGCPFDCSFCSIRLIDNPFGLENKAVRRRSVDNVIAELKNIDEKTSTVYFVDANFTLDNRWLKEFSKKYKKDIGLPFSCSTHPAAMNYKKAELLKEAGCYHIYLGVQSASEYSRRKILNRWETNEQISQTVKAIKEYKINVSVDHILGIPYETEQEYILAANFYNQLRPTRINSFWLTLYPKTKIVQIAKEAGIIDDSDIEKIEDSLGQRPEIWGGSVSTEERRRLAKYETLFYLIPLFPPKIIKFLIDSKFFRFLPCSFFINTVLLFATAIKTRDRKMGLFIKHFSFHLWKQFSQLKIRYINIRRLC